MIITLTQYIFLLLLINNFVYAKNIDVTFEVFHAKNNYIDIAQQKAIELQEDGFKCYVIKGKTDLSLRCNDSNTTTEMQRNINKLNKKNIVFSIINRDTKITQTQYKSLNEFYLGYAAFDRKEYVKALEIFEYNYKQENNYEHAYAYSLALMKTGNYEKSLQVLKQYDNIDKANKLSNDIASTFMYKELNRKNYKRAHEIVDKYRKKSQKFHNIIDKQEVDDSIKNKEYVKASALAKEYDLADKSFDIEYMRALDLVKIKKYDEANLILAPYAAKESQAYNLFLSNVIASASIPYAAKNYKEALEKLEKYRASTKVQALYDDILYNRSLENGWTFVDKNPQNALTSFKEACRIKKEFGCYNGMMYSYFNLEMFEKSFYLAEKLYDAKPSDELSVVAMRSSLKMKDFDNAKAWFDKVSNKKGLTSPYLLETFLTIDDYIKVKDYDEAQNIVSYLKSLYPQNMEVLKREMQLYIVQKKYDEAQDVAQEILLIDKESIEAKYTLALYEFEHKDYSGCASRLSDVNLTQEYQSQLYNRCKAYTSVEKKDINSAIKYMNKIDDDGMKVAFYLDVGDVYKSQGESEAIRAYQEAKKYNNSFNVELIYLYSLKDFTKDDDLDKELLAAYKNYPENTKELDKFKITYQKDRLYSYYKNKRYGECYNYSNVIEEEQNDEDVYKMGGWCAYSLEKYEEAKEKFAKLNTIFGEKAQNIYPYALSCYQNKEYERATQALNRIEFIDTKKDTLLIASLYMDLQEQARARELLLKLDESKERDAMLVKINKSYTVDRYETAASMGIYYQSQTGIEGKNKFDKFVVPIDTDYYDKEYTYHLFFDGDLLYLYNGYLTNGNASYLDYGLGTNTQDDALASDVGFMPKVGIDYKNIKAQIGTTPIGAKISPELTWLLSGYLTASDWIFSLAYEQEEMDETMLAFVGEKAVDGPLEVNWGRVVKRGFEAGVSYDANVNLSLNLAYYPQIFGLNVEDNSEKKATLTAIYHPKVESISYVDIGTLVAFDSYDKNSNSFTYGHGGYFSPQDFWLGSLFTQFGDILSTDVYYQAKLALGFEGFIVEDSLRFPLDDGVVNSGAIQKGYRDGGLTYKGALQLGYKLNNNLDLISGVSLEKMNGYSVKQLSFALVYRFEPNIYRTFNTFGLNHRVDQIIK